MLLLLRLDMGQHLARVGVGELENAGVIQRCGVLFGGQQVAAQEFIACAVVLALVADGGTVPLSISLTVFSCSRSAEAMELKSSLSSSAFASAANLPYFSIQTRS